MSDALADPGPHGAVPMSITVRPATLRDAPTLVEYNRRLAMESESLDLDASRLAAGVAAALADPAKARYLVAEEDGQVIGQLMLTTEWSDWRNGWMWWIQSVYVRAGARRKGVFRVLFDRVCADARANGQVIGVRLYVERENHAAQETYRRVGMTPTGYLVFETCPLSPETEGAGEAGR